MERPAVSIIMLVYNHARTVGRALESVFNQEYSFKAELIISNDCSTDGSAEVIEKFLMSRSKADLEVINLKRDKNLGLGKNWSECNKMARGRYIAVCEGDDAWTFPSKLQEQFEILESNGNIGIACGNNDLVNESGILVSYSRKRKEGVFRLEDIRRKNFISTCTAMFRNGLIRFSPEWEAIVTQDYIGWEMILSAGYQGFYTEKKLALQNVLSTGSYSSKSRLVKTRMFLQALEFLLADELIKDKSYLKKRIVFTRYKLSGMMEDADMMSESYSMLRKAAFEFSPMISPGTRLKALAGLAGRLMSVKTDKK